MSGIYGHDTLLVDEPDGSWQAVCEECDWTGIHWPRSAVLAPEPMASIDSVEHQEATRTGAEL